ncbi:MAG: aldehyde dehydrogenase family protein [Bdellovibrionaceae bacterium]|nr:aldehyde dehydrogenase family protein [Pseudobdellovibrionaceae bacterium]
MSPFYQFVEGKITSLTTSNGAEFTDAISIIQKLNTPHPILRQKIDLTSSLHIFLKKFENQKSFLIHFLVETLGYTDSEAHNEWNDGYTLLQELAKDCYFDPHLRTPRGLVAIALPWSSPLYRFCAQIIPALIAQNHVVLFCDKDSSQIYTQLAEWVHLCEMGHGKIAVLSSATPDVRDLVRDHPAIKNLHVESHLYEAQPWRPALLNPDKLCRFFHGAHNAVIVLNDANLKTIKPLFLRSLNYHLKSEIRFNRWFVQEKIYPALIDEMKKWSTEIEPEYFGKPTSSSYRKELLAQLQELRNERYWLKPLSEQADHWNVVTDFSNCSPVHQKELLGPFLTITRVKNISEASKFANTTDYSNSVCVITASQEKSLELRLLLKTLYVFHNRIPTPHTPHLTYGEGFCGTGLGTTNDLFYANKKELFEENSLTSSIDG